MDCTWLAPVDLPKGGVWKICYCADFAEAGTACDADTEHLVQAGELTVAGADGIGLYSCAKNEPCTITIAGTGLQATDAVQVVAISASCGAAASTHFSGARARVGSGSGASRSVMMVTEERLRDPPV